MLCHTGRITFSPETSRDVSPSSSFSGHSLAKKLGLKMTIPYLELAKPLSIERRRLSPTVSVNSSNHTRSPFALNASANGRTKDSLSSHAWLMKTSHSIFLPQAQPSSASCVLFSNADGLDQRHNTKPFAPRIIVESTQINVWFTQLNWRESCAYTFSIPNASLTESKFPNPRSASRITVDDNLSFG